MLRIGEILGNKVENHFADVEFELKAIIIYDGNRSNGHYFGVFKKGIEWVEINDNEVRRLSFDLNTRKVKNVGKLIYQRR